MKKNADFRWSVWIGPDILPSGYDIHSSPWFGIDGPYRNRWFTYEKCMVIFHGYVKQPDGKDMRISDFAGIFKNKREHYINER